MYQFCTNLTLRYGELYKLLCESEKPKAFDISGFYRVLLGNIKLYENAQFTTIPSFILYISPYLHLTGFILTQSQNPVNTGVLYKFLN